MDARGFSLIELLVVISIIAVLAAMLLPTIGMVKGMAMATGCAARLRQVGMAYVAYTGEHDACLPNTAVGINSLQADPAKMDDYLVSTDKAWYCTDAKLAATMRFYQNWWLLDQGSPNTNIEQIYGSGKHVIHYGMILHPTDAFIAADLNQGSNGGYHRGYANMVHADGHVLTRKDSSLTVTTPAWVWMDPGPSIKTEHIYRPGTGKLKGFTY